VSIEKLKKLARETKAEFIDLKFSDLPGTWHHITIPISALGPKLFAHGVGVDGSHNVVITGFFESSASFSGTNLSALGARDGYIAKYDVLEVVRSTNREPQRSESEIEDESSLEPILAGRGDIREEVLANAQARTTDLGIEILDIQFKRINYVEEVQRKVYERMIAERKRIADRFRSEGEGEAFRIIGEKDRELLRIRSEAYRKAQEIKGAADAEATNIYAGAYDRSADTRSFYEFLKTMEAYKQIMDSESSLVLSTDADIYRFLKGSDQQ